MADSEITAVKDIEVLFTHEDKEILDAMVYLQLKDERKTMDEIAAHFGYKTRKSINDKVNRWRDEGVLDKARAKYYIPKGEEVKAAISRVMDSVPAMLDRMVKIVKMGREHNAIAAFEILMDRVVTPTMENQPAGGSAEQKWAERSAKGISDPMSIKLPKNIDEIIVELEE
jgi:K+ transporter